MDGNGDRFVTNRQLYDELTKVRDEQVAVRQELSSARDEDRNQRVKLWLAIFAIGAMNGSALVKAFGAPSPSIIHQAEAVWHLFA